MGDSFSLDFLLVCLVPFANRHKMDLKAIAHAQTIFKNHWQTDIQSQVNYQMDDQLIFNFKTNISTVDIPKKLNNPFGLDIPEIAKIAAGEFQDFIAAQSQDWDYNFNVQKGKMFGVLVVQKADNSPFYLATVSGTLTRNTNYPNFIPSVFDDSIDDYFINRGMSQLTALSNAIENTVNDKEKAELAERRRLKSIALQKRLFENYQFLNMEGIEKNLLQIFKETDNPNPPSAAGECAAPKLLQFAHKNGLRPIALAEFWWGNPKNQERIHKNFYPACRDKCKPILEFMLSDGELYVESQIASKSF